MVDGEGGALHMSWRAQSTAAEPQMTVRTDLLRRLKSNLETLHPAYFALVMATGIVALGCQLLKMAWVAEALFGLNLALFAVLLALTIARILWFPGRLVADLLNYRRGVGFFTLTAACCILGSQFVLIADFRPPAVVLWWLGIGLWLVITYVVFGGFVIEKSKPSLSESMHGGWLAAVVATQSISVLGAMLAEGFGPDRERVLFFSLAMWLVGGMNYIWIISLLFYRYWFFPVGPQELSAAYWINMGAMAISTLAGTQLAAEAPSSSMLAPLLPFLKGFTLFYWATATWWIPILVILGVWRHAARNYRFVYDPLAWEAVFPVGMYTACTFQIAGLLDLSFLQFIPRSLIYVALAMWCLTFAGMVGSIARNLTGRPAGDHDSPRTAERKQA
jgi:tellurite resistance protein TehA-like permease